MIDFKNINWYHEFVFPQGLSAISKAPDVNFHRKLWQFIKRYLDEIDFRNKEVLDIGCWDGKWSFYAEKRGASHVLATDDFTQNWATDDGIRLAKELLKSNIEIMDLNVYDLNTINKTFDIVLFLGVYYHLHDPLYALSQIRHTCNKDSTIVIEGSVGCNYGENEARYCFDDLVQSTFLPAEQLWNKMLRAAYFDIVSEHYFSIDFLKARKELIKEPYADRKLIVCRPFEGENKLHYYKPPFGLDKYDKRW